MVGTNNLSCRFDFLEYYSLSCLFHKNIYSLILDDEEMSDRRYNRLKKIKLGKTKPDVAFVSQVSGSGLSRPPCFDIPIDNADCQHLQNLGFCPIHRHPVLANFIHVLHNLLYTEVSNCLRAVDFSRAQAAYPKEENPVYQPEGITQLDFIYDVLLKHPSDVLGQGLDRFFRPDYLGVTQRITSCKGSWPHPLILLFIVNL